MNLIISKIGLPATLEQLAEEAADVRLCLKVLEDAFIMNMEEAEGAKLNRWLDRLMKVGDLNA